MRWLRSVGAVAAGFVVFALVIGFFAHVVGRAFSIPVLLETLGYSVIAAVIAGYLTAWIAGRRELAHAAALGMLMIALSVASMRQQGEARPGLYESTIAGCGPIAAFVGAALKRLSKLN